MEERAARRGERLVPQRSRLIRGRVSDVLRVSPLSTDSTEFNTRIGFFFARSPADNVTGTRYLISTNQLSDESFPCPGPGAWTEVRTADGDSRGRSSTRCHGVR